MAIVRHLNESESEVFVLSSSEKQRTFSFQVKLLRRDGREEITVRDGRIGRRRWRIRTGFRRDRFGQIGQRGVLITFDLRRSFTLVERFIVTLHFDLPESETKGSNPNSRRKTKDETRRTTWSSTCSSSRILDEFYER